MLEITYVVACILGAIFMFTMIEVYYKHRTIYPPGKRFRRRWKGHKINVIIHEHAQVPSEAALRDAALKALQSVVAACEVYKVYREGLAAPLNGFTDPIQTCNVYILPREYTAISHVTNFSGVLTCVIPDKDYSKSVLEGDPLIHLLVTTCLSHKPEVDETLIWASMGPNTLESIAIQYFRRLQLAY